MNRLSELYKLKEAGLSGRVACLLTYGPKQFTLEHLLNWSHGPAGDGSLRIELKRIAGFGPKALSEILALRRVHESVASCLVSDENGRG